MRAGLHFRLISTVIAVVPHAVHFAPSYGLIGDSLPADRDFLIHDVQMLAA